jgi:hypothetical protein
MRAVRGNLDERLKIEKRLGAQLLTGLKVVGVKHGPQNIKILNLALGWSSTPETIAISRLPRPLLVLCFYSEVYVASRLPKVIV